VGRDLVYQPLYDPRLVDGKLVVPPTRPFYLNSRRGDFRAAL
jgi:hypothetical protein